MNVIETRGLGRRYGGTWALRDCTLAIPEGHLVALVGPNGAGKTTLLNIVVGLTAPTTGDVTVLGGLPAGSPAALDGIAFVAQDMPLYRHLSVADMLHLTRNLNHDFDAAYARGRLADLGIAEKHKTGKLSGGQQAQLALTLALARHPRLLVLDEPTAPLDPLARHDFMATVMTAMAEDGLSVAPLLARAGRAGARRRLPGADHPRSGPARRHGRGPARRAPARDRPGRAAARTRRGTSSSPRWPGRSSTCSSASTRPPIPMPAGWQARPVGVEELALAYLRDVTAAPAP